MSVFIAINTVAAVNLGVFICSFICLKVFSNFPCDLFFDPLIKGVVKFPQNCQFSSFPPAIEFWFHSF